MDIAFGGIRHKTQHFTLGLGQVIAVRACRQSTFQFVKLRDVPGCNFVHHSLQNTRVYFQLFLSLQQGRKGINGRGQFSGAATLRGDHDCYSCRRLAPIRCFGPNLRFSCRDILQLRSITLNSFRKWIKLVSTVKGVIIGIQIITLLDCLGRAASIRCWFHSKYHPVGTVIQDIVNECLIGRRMLNGCNEIRIAIQNDQEWPVV
mmetsp:Transcript_11523/g.20988  ORF Transcript_11523/g.20988 Transcript_11523/m.20988 type:complete len:204 (-) Transcript_11523:1003-1614(-)